ncbi:MAG: MaoC/PaaZ C-terminal domain-containing protein [bacterium]
MAEQLFFEDFKIGDTFSSPPRTLDEPAFLAFARLTGDDHPIHYDLDYCRARGFPERLAHGLLTTSLTVLGASDLAPRIHDSLIAFLDHTHRLLSPVFLGDTLTPSLAVHELKPQHTTGVLTLRATLHNQRNEAVLEGEHRYLLKLRKPL